MKIFDWFKKSNKPLEIDEQTMQLVVTGRAQGLMALWAAERMGKTSEGAANYADEVVANNLSDDNLLKKIDEDLQFHEQNIEFEDLKERLAGFKQVAKLETQDELEFYGDCK